MPATPSPTSALRRSPVSRARWPGCLGLLVLLAVIAPPAAAQVIDDVEELAWDRPEAWAMKYFNSVSLLTGLGPPRTREPWSIELGLEAGLIPHLDEDQRRIGFGGAKVEDINRVPVLVRPRLTVGLPARFSLDVGWVPPVEIDGATSNIVGVALERPLYESGPWAFGIRAYGQLGRVSGDFTCSEDEAGFPPGSPENFWGCEEPSDDELTLDHAGAALTGGYRIKTIDLHWGVAATYMDMEFQVDAVTFGIVDRTLLLADGWTWSVNGGASWRLGSRTSLSAEVFYSPLSVVRPPSTVQDNDPLLNVRTMLRFDL